MKFDINFIKDYLKDTNATSTVYDERILKIDFGNEIILHIENAVDENDSLFAFEGGEWHHHDEIIQFSDKDGYYIEMNYMDFLEAILKGEVLICSEYKKGVLKDRYPIHQKYLDELSIYEPGDEVRFFRVNVTK